jgi:hypothetical protein
MAARVPTSGQGGPPEPPGSAPPLTEARESPEHYLHRESVSTEGVYHHENLSSPLRVHRTLGEEARLCRPIFCHSTSRLVLWGRRSAAPVRAAMAPPRTSGHAVAYPVEQSWSSNATLMVQNRSGDTSLTDGITTTES